uniref:MFS domain-containing protein n=1 Tax=Macrostomum lignano TaxID=282301 RepID=A0A1I8GK01_9PLAT
DRASSWILYRDILAAVGAVISIPLLSSSSDRHGRKVALVLPCLGTLAESVVSLCVIWFRLPLICMLIAAAVSGLCGGIGCLFSGALAYLADITAAKSRPMRIAVLEALTGIGGAGSCVLVGWWIRWQGFLIPHAFCTSLYVLTALFCIFVVPEVRRAAESQHQQPSSSIRRLLVEPLSDLASLMSMPHSLPTVYALVLSGLALYCAAFFGTVDLTVLYSMNFPFCLDSVLIGYFSAARQVALQIGMLFAVSLCRRLGLSTLTIASIGTVSTAAGDVLLAMATDRRLLWLSIAASVAAACPVPMYRAFVSMVTPADKQGCAFSLFGVLQMLFYLFGNLAYTSVYRAALVWQP